MVKREFQEKSTTCPSVILPLCVLKITGLIFISLTLHLKRNAPVLQERSNLAEPPTTNANRNGTTTFRSIFVIFLGFNIFP